MERMIGHLDLDCFFVAVERLRDTRLVDKPVIVGGMSDRGVVSACSYETRRFGVHSAMPMRLARQLCPEAIVLRGDMEAYSQHSAAVTEIIRDRVPVMEKASVDEFYVDMSGMDRYFGSWKYLQEVGQEIHRETGLTISLGLSGNKTVSKVAANEGKPHARSWVVQGTEKAFLAPLSIHKLPFCGEVTTQTLRQMGIHAVGTLSQMPLPLLEKTFGKNGRILWERANGVDPTPVVPLSEPKSFSKERTFDADTTDLVFLYRTLTRLTEALGFDLRREGYCTGCITVKIRYSSFDTHTRQVSIPATSADHVLLQHVEAIFYDLYDRRLRIRLIGVRLSKLVRGVEQLKLFDQSARLAPMYQAMDYLRQKYGSQAVGRAAGLSPSDHKPCT